MSQNIKQCRKKSSMPVPKHASVSLDCLLGLLSSAYGTEQIDLTILDKNRIENFTRKNIVVVAPKKEEIIKNKTFNTFNEVLGLEHRIKDNICVATSTTSLKYSCTEDGEETTGMIPAQVDVQELILHEQEPIHFESKFAHSGYILQNEGIKNGFNDFEEMCKLSYVGLDPPPTDIGEFIDNDDQYDSEHVICEFHANGDYLTFDIKFTKMHSMTFIHSDLNNLLSNGVNLELTINLKDTSKSSWTKVNVCKKRLISKSRYFYNVNEEYGLDSMDVSVKCNSFNTIKWVFQWLNSESPMFNPIITTANVNGIIFIAFNLQIDQLIEECLDFFHVNYSKLGCENVDSCLDKLMLKLVLKFNNYEINSMDNGFEILQSKLFTSLIQMLIDKNPNKAVGHYSSLASIFQCDNCKKIFHCEMRNIVACRADCNKLNAQGKFVPTHECSISWNLYKYIEFLYEQSKSWQKVYWSLWGMCHFLTCSKCNIPYPVCQSEWCPYHSAVLEYFPISANLSHPIGVYSCCGEISFKFNVLDVHTGCSYQCHVPAFNSIDDEHIYRIYQTHKDIINLQPPINNATLNKNVKLIKTGDETLTLNGVKRESFWWEGIQITPKIKEDYSIIPKKLFDKFNNISQPIKNSTNHPELNKLQVAMGSVPIHTHTFSSCSPDDQYIKKNKFILISKTKSSTKLPLMKHRKKKKKSLSYTYDQVESLWNCSESIKYNQDNQREFEEVVMHSLVEILSPANAGFIPKSSAGTYIRLEADWWQNICYDSKITSCNKHSGTVVNRTFPLSWFRRLTI